MYLLTVGIFLTDGAVKKKKQPKNPTLLPTI